MDHRTTEQLLRDREITRVAIRVDCPRPPQPLDPHREDRALHHSRGYELRGSPVTLNNNNVGGLQVMSGPPAPFFVIPPTNAVIPRGLAAAWFPSVPARTWCLAKKVFLPLNNHHPLPIENPAAIGTL
jgi:hypothetical protein